MIIGVDVSSHRIDLAWLENNRPCRWHQDLGSGHLIDRVKRIEPRWPHDSRGIAGGEVTDIAIEYPFAVQKPAVAALMAVVGAITMHAPQWARVAWPSSGELRQAIGARNTKVEAHDQIRIWSAVYTPCSIEDWDEHELDALTACIGWTRILEAQDAA